jgi:DNA-binding PadR family transcriptional regulator
MFYILFALAAGEKHGYAIMQQCSQLSAGKFRMGPATLYTTIQRLLDLALIEETQTSNEGERRRRYYRLSRPGKLLLEAEIGRMEDIVSLARRQKAIAHATK